MKLFLLFASCRVNVGRGVALLRNCRCARLSPGSGGIFAGGVKVNALLIDVNVLIVPVVGLVSRSRLNCCVNLVLVIMKIFCVVFVVMGCGKGLVDFGG